MTVQVDGRLAVVEEPDRVLVVLEDDPEDWLAAFAKGGGFPARAWAENMVAVYNARLSSASSRRPRAASGP